MRSALVTGGAGFIGSHLVNALVEDGRRVTVLDDLSTGRWENLFGALNHGVRLTPGNVTDPHAVARALTAERPDTIYHLAAQIDVRHAVADPIHDAVVNLIGTLTLLQAAQRHGVRRFVLASTGGAIYGEADVLPTPESAEVRPASPYAASKAAAESYLDLYRTLFGLSTLSLRLSNVYGPRQNGAGEAGVVAMFCAAARAGHPVTVFGDGGQTRDFLYVDDVVRAFMAAGERPVTGCVNVATGRETTVLAVAQELGLRVRHAPERAGEVRRSCLDPSRAAAALGWAARVAFTDGLDRTLTSMAPATRRAPVASVAP
ncbi:GDP-mannose 4,6-dehydratase [Solirubrobacter sp. CPCC 204708]|uniref:GDP-mannose 4,6-dehydratase n=1 Tax=Solirubrobacter deserti TaxID=2282478 RepID=A0ABT4RF78_9ACTN|nr:GDP-mannose 4,6-dehydratase [Solirubrobacter deserti]MBE2319515.1 GDP-mannose 4,6-dehydratase [Solirubrobacter deserti]MDA0137198.1 GDP-mannose 4,6-dehydratase [Solirubrobacter deserti]